MNATITLDDEVRRVLNDAQIDGSRLVLVGQLERTLYERVSKAITALGGKWNRKEKAHLFPSDVRELIAAAVTDGEVTDLKKLHQFYRTPPELAARMVRRLEPGRRRNLLEPSAGEGAIARYMQRDRAVESRLMLVETDVRHRNELEQAMRIGDPVKADTVEYRFLDFLDMPPEPVYDAIAMNPPFTNGQDAHHVARALSMLASGGRLVAVMSRGIRFRDTEPYRSLRERLESMGADCADLPPATFAESGTSVNTSLVVVDAPGVSTPDPVVTKEPSMRSVEGRTTEGGSAQMELIPDEKAPPQYREFWIDTLPANDALGNPSPDYAGSIADLGMIYPLVLRDMGKRWPGQAPGVEVADGARRLASARALLAKGGIGEEQQRTLGINPVRCLVYPATYAFTEVLSLTLNAQRTENVWRDVDAIRRLIERGFSLEAIGKQLRMKKARVLKRMRLAALPESILNGLRDGTVKAGVAEGIAGLPPRQQGVLDLLMREQGKLTGEDVKAARQVGARVATASLDAAIFNTPRLERLAPPPAAPPEPPGPSDRPDRPDPKLAEEASILRSLERSLSIDKLSVGDRHRLAEIAGRVAGRLEQVTHVPATMGAAGLEGRVRCAVCERELGETDATVKAPRADGMNMQTPLYLLATRPADYRGPRVLCPTCSGKEMADETLAAMKQADAEKPGLPDLDAPAPCESALMETVSGIVAEIRTVALHLPGKKRLDKVELSKWLNGVADTLEEKRA